MKVSELTGIELDFWVVKAEGFKNVTMDKKSGLLSQNFENTKNQKGFSYPHWNFIGPIIERDKIELQPRSDKWAFCWYAFPDGKEDDLLIGAKGQTAIEAIKRLIVKNKYGESVNDQ